MSAPDLSTEFEQSARKAAVKIAQKFIDAAKQKQRNTWTMSSVAMACAVGPFAMQLASPWPLALIAAPLIMYKAMRDTHQTQKQMQEGFEEMMDLVPEQARGIVHSELDTMAKTLRSFRTDLSKKDILPANDKTGKRMMEVGASIVMLMPPFTPLAIPSFFYLLLRKESTKTTAMIGQADAVLERNKDLLPKP